MEYQKVVNLLDNAPNQPTKFSTKNWVKVNKGSMTCTALVVK